MNSQPDHIIISFQYGSSGALIVSLVNYLLISPENRFSKTRPNQNFNITLSDVGDAHKNGNLQYVHAVTKEDMLAAVSNGLPKIFETHFSLVEYMTEIIPNSKVIYIHHNEEDYKFLSFNHFWKASCNGNSYLLDYWSIQVQEYSEKFPEEFETIKNKLPWDITKSEYRTVLKAHHDKLISEKNDFTKNVSSDRILQIEFQDIRSGNTLILEKLATFLNVVPDSYAEFILKRYSIAQKSEEQLLHLLKD